MEISVERILNKKIKYGLYLLVFLLPLFFLPLTNFPVVLNKQMLLAIFAFLLLIFCAVKIISSGKLKFRWDKITLCLLLFILVQGLSTLFSKGRAQSFWGMSFEADTFFNFILYTLLFLFLTNLLGTTETKTDPKQPGSGTEIKTETDVERETKTGTETETETETRIGTEVESEPEPTDDKKSPLEITLFIFLASSGVLAILFLLQSLWRPIFPWDFAKFAGFNSIGTVQSLGVFLGGAFVVLLALFTEKINLKKLTFISAIILGILLFISILLINFWVIFLLIAFSAVIILWNKLKLLIDNEKMPKNVSLPLIVLAISLILIFIRIPTGNIVNLPVEVSPTHKATFDIAKKTLLEGPKNFILGSGPATFKYDYDLYRSQGPNITDFWHVRFSQGSAFLPTLLATGGVLSILAVLLLMIIFFWQGVNTIARKEGLPDKEGLLDKKGLPGAEGLAPGLVAAFIGSFYFLFAWFFYPINFSLAFATFLMLGLWVKGIEEAKKRRVEAEKSKVKELSFGGDPQKTLLLMVICIILIVVSFVGLYTISQKYRGALAFSKGLSLINTSQPDLDKGIENLAKAANLDKKDVYFTNLSQAFLFKINRVLTDQELSQKERDELFQRLSSNAELSAKTARRLNPSNSQNWLQQGIVYENLMLLNIAGAGQSAVSSYQKAKELAPQNPQIPLSLGRVYKTQSQMIQNQITLLKENQEENQEVIAQLEENRDRTFDLALKNFRESIELKNNFSPAYYLLAQLYEIMGEKELALQNYLIVRQLEPENEKIETKIEELKESQ